MGLRGGGNPLKTLTDISAALAEPFPLKDIELLPKGSYEQNGKTVCMAMPYADPRCYQDRLNKLAYGEWSTPPPLALTVGDKLVCYVTVVLCGIPHTDVGEAGPGENQATEAFAQAFKRACSQFGLGRYLYDLEKAWVPYDAKKKRIDLDTAGIEQVVRQMYAKAHIGSIAHQNGQQAAQANGHADEAHRAELNRLYASGRQMGAFSDKAGMALWAKGILCLEAMPNLLALTAEQLVELSDAMEQVRATSGVA